MRAQIRALSTDRVTVTADDEYGERRTTEYFVSPARERDGHYYVQIDDGRQFPQVCDGLRRVGPTLMVYGDRPLIDVIRREYYAGQRAARALRD